MNCIEACPPVHGTQTLEVPQHAAGAEYAVGGSVPPAKLRQGLREREMIHRAKNSLALVHSMLMVQADMLENVPEAKEALEAAAGRVRSVGLLYDKLFELGEEDALPLDIFASGLLDDILSCSSASVHVRLQKDLPSVYVDARRLSSIGIILNELVTNALKHAFPAGRSGTVWINGEHKDGRLRLSVADDGPGISVNAGRKPEGFGLMMARSLAEQLGGNLGRRGTEGACFILDIPL